MADTEETPSQRQARIRREKREAKIIGSGTERLDKITKLSGRTPESSTNSNYSARLTILIFPVRNESPTPLSSPIPPSQPTSPPSQPTGPPSQPTGPTPLQPTSPPPNLTNAASPAQTQAQEEYLRKLLRTPAPQQGQGQQGQQAEVEDPMLSMMNQMFGNLGGDSRGEGGLPFSSDDLAKATGLPAFITDMFMGKQRSPPTPAEEKADRMWNIIHTLFALLAGAYVVFVVGRSIDTFGVNSPAPATFQNPFLVFIMGELLIQGFKTVGAGQGAKKGPWLWLQVLKDLARDGCIVVFVMGAVGWWKGQS